jgi:putative transposase
MMKDSMPVPIWPRPRLEEAWQDVGASFDRFCLSAGIEALEQMLCEDAVWLCGARHQRGGARVGHRWGETRGRLGFHGGKVLVRRPRVRGREGKEKSLPTWEKAVGEDWLGRWALNLMLINVSTRRFSRAVRLSEGDLPAAAGDGTSKSAASRRFVALWPDQPCGAGMALPPRQAKGHCTIELCPVRHGGLLRPCQSRYPARAWAQDYSHARCFEP